MIDKSYKELSILGAQGRLSEDEAAVLHKKRRTRHIITGSALMAAFLTAILPAIINTIGTVILYLKLGAG